MQCACLVQHHIPRSLLQARLGDIGAVSWQSALWAADSLPHGWLSPCHQRGYPRGMLSLELSFGVPHSSGISLTGTSLRLTVLGKQWHLLRAIAPLIMAEGRNKTACSPSQESVRVFAVFSVLLMIKKLQSMGLFLLPHFCMPVSRVVTWAGGKTAKVPL